MMQMQLKRSLGWFASLFLTVFIVSCGPSPEARQSTIAVQVAQAVSGTMAALPVAPSLTPLPTLTPRSTYTFRPTLTSLATLTEQPTYTWQPTLTPVPTATAIPTATITPTRPPIAAAPPPAAVNGSIQESLLFEVNRRIFYYESYIGVFLARCTTNNYTSCDTSIRCNLVVQYFDLLTAPYTLDVSQAEGAVKIAYEKVQLAITIAAAGYGWANVCREALANGSVDIARQEGQGYPSLSSEVIALLREAQNLLSAP